MHRKISDLKLEEAAITRLAKGKVLEAPRSHSIFNSNHNRVGTELSLGEVMREGKEHTIRRYSQTIGRPPTILILRPLSQSEINPLFVPEPPRKKNCCSIM
jgi:16S rRNA U516 pseudouridylate synthase RsuA-like enzyme